MEQAAHDAQGAAWNQEVFPVIRNLRALLVERGTPEDLPPAIERNSLASAQPKGVSNRA
jgi:hypothetical protein